MSVIEDQGITVFVSTYGRRNFRILALGSRLSVFG